jgi:hypothetical protein
MSITPTQTSLQSLMLEPVSILSQSSLQTSPLQTVPVPGKSIAFIDAGVADHQTLVAGLAAGTEVVVLTGGDAIGQITQALLGQQGIASVQFFSHGQNGSLRLGNSWLNAATLPSYVSQLKSWGEALTTDADILLYGCNVAQDEVGQAFVSLLAQATGTDVAASDDLTGSATLGGDWDLEVKTGEVSLPSALSTFNSYQHILPLNYPGYTESVFVNNLPGPSSGMAYDVATQTMYYREFRSIKKIAANGMISTISQDFANGVYFSPGSENLTDVQYANGYLYTVAGGTIFQIDPNTGISTGLNSLTTTQRGQVGIAFNNNKLFLTIDSNNGRSLVEYDPATGSSIVKINNLPPDASTLEYDAVKNKYYFAAGRNFYVANPDSGTFSQLNTASLPGSSELLGNFVIDPNGNYLYARTYDNLPAIIRISTNDGSYSIFQSGLPLSPEGDLVFGRSSSGSGGSLFIITGNQITEIAGFDAPAAPSIPASNWLIAATADFDRDGDLDILRRNTATGENQIWQMNGSTRAATINLLTVTGNNYRIEGVADFDGDGKVDIFWRDYASGYNTVWKMDGMTLVQGIGVRGEASLSAKVEAIADFDGDGKVDLLWRDYATGYNTIWKMDGTNVVQGINLRGEANPNAKIAGVADFDGDGKVDLLWRDYSTGINTIWKMDGMNLISGIGIRGEGNLNAEIEGVADFDGDGKVDVLWRDRTTGYNTIWKMNGSNVAQGIALPGLSGLNARVQRIGDFDGDAQVDLLWENRANNISNIWKLDTVNFISNIVIQEM